MPKGKLLSSWNFFEVWLEVGVKMRGRLCELKTLLRCIKVHLELLPRWRGESGNQRPAPRETEHPYWSVEHAA